jgi:hypothetical protein
MALPRLIQRVLHTPRRSLRELLRYIQVARLTLINLYGKDSVSSPCGPVVSLTTFGNRSGKAHLAIESIACGCIRPSRLLLWIDEETLLCNLPPALRRLQERGLEIHFCKNYGPHKKYYPYLESQESFHAPLVTADDDVLYPSYWLRELVRAYDDYPDGVNCYLAHVIALRADGIEKYREWKACVSTLPDFRHIAIGLAGVIYPPSLLMLLKRAGPLFETCCPKGDDLWLHAQALRSGYKVRQILPCLPYFSFQGVPGTEKIALSHENITLGDGNDRQIQATYDDSDLHLLQIDSKVVTSH